MKSNKQLQKPESLEEKVDLIWEAAFNHIPTQINWLNLKLTFILTFVALILGLLTFLGIAFIVGQ